METEKVDASQHDPDGLAREFEKVQQAKIEIREYDRWLRQELGKLAVDSPDQILVTSYGRFKAYKNTPQPRWDRETVAKDVRDVALLENIAVDADPDVTEMAFRAHETYSTVFRLEPRKNALKKLGLNPDNYLSGGEPWWDVTPLKDDDEYTESPWQ